AELVEAQVAGHRVNPAPEVERIIDAIHHPERLHERLLGDVLGQQGVAELAPDEAEDGSDVPTVELLERVDVAGTVGAHELHVRGACGHLGGRIGIVDYQRPSLMPGPANALSSPAASTTSGAPLTRLAPRNAIRPAPAPPAAPAPGTPATSLPRSRAITSASRPSARSSSWTAWASAPFCGPYTALA